ncbi:MULTISPECIES: CFI-box-CTERM domain-containing protein [unclassified Arcicella]|uniref:CFI-box-CTERM domain-containing protein n=1 Tax=unclassified Arcicella TaxID=2644986 RepID=UPI00285AD239|nr:MULTISPECIES: CFI-box-CTERM domain-containing protein [unclassified Arcicella]MDR6561269.1 hypothetical protein [Arcicella sp. BE51]MDR6811153.1 hypothetical protein [Arcicella sp. BE140]MDR6822503.1 hypothetical protein [Arcicella sp. BE139]
MQIIQNNPYRVIGLLVGTTAAEQRRQLTRLQRYLEAEQEPETDFCFPILGNLHRTTDSVIEAASKLNLDNDKMSAALFWFYKGNDITDEPAFEELKVANQQSCYEIWIKLTSSGEVTKRNSSAYHNLSTLLLLHAFNTSKIKLKLLEQGISLKLKYLESNYAKDLKLLATDETYKITNAGLQRLFLNEIQLELERFGVTFSEKFLNILTKQEFSAKEDFLKGFVQKPIQEIEKKIEEAKTKRKANKANAVNIGNALYEQIAEKINQLKSILGTSNLEFSSISDKGSDEILQCGIDYFLHYKDSSTDPGSASMDLFRKAETLAIGNIAKQRCQENAENLQEWIDDKPERDKQGRILVDLGKLKNLIDEYEARDETIANAKQLLASARQYLNNLKNILGSTDELYLGFSSRIASDAQGMCVSEINKLQEKFSNTYDDAIKVAAILLLKERVNEAWDITTTIGSMDMRQDFRTRYIQNRTSLSNLKAQFEALNIARETSSGGSSGSGCYIATMAYGYYDHPQVIILRQFRDEVLDKSAFGKWFIKTYYNYSPKLVEKLRNKKVVNSIIRKTLNQFIKLIK